MNHSLIQKFVSYKFVILSHCLSVFYAKMFNAHVESASMLSKAIIGYHFKVTVTKIHMYMFSFGIVKLSFFLCPFSFIWWVYSSIHHLVRGLSGCTVTSIFINWSYLVQWVCDCFFPWFALPLISLAKSICYMVKK